MKKKILLISYLFAPNNSVGAFRPTKWAGILAENGCEVDVITYGKRAFDDDLFFKHTDIAHKYVMNSAARDAAGGRKAGVSHMAASVKRILRGRCGRMWIRMASLRTHASQIRSGLAFLRFVKTLTKRELKDEDYDVMITSFGPVASVFAGLYLKKEKQKMKWICDFRDPIPRKNTPLVFKPLFYVLQDKACRGADKIIVVSQGDMKQICRREDLRKKALLIPNGFDEEDIPQMDTDEIRQKMRMTYTGKLYRGRSDLSPLFKALKELAGESLIDLEKIVICYAGKDCDVIMDQSEKFHMADIVENRGFIPRKDCLKLQARSELLIIATWNNKGDEGVFTGKFPEYMMMRRPVVALTSGDLGGGEVTEVVREGNFGIAYEEAHDGRDFPALKKYIKTQYENFISGKGIFYSPHEKVRQRYSYGTIKGQVLSLIDSLDE